MDLLTVPEIAKVLKLGNRTIYNMVEAKTIPHYRLGRKVIRFEMSQIEKWLETKMVDDPFTYDRYADLQPSEMAAITQAELKGC